MMLRDLRKRARKAGQPPGTPTYTGNKTDIVPRVTVFTYDENNFHEASGTKLDDCLPAQPEKGVTWINVEGLHETSLIEQIALRFNLHPLTVEDILNVDQRPKVEEYEGYLFLSLKLLLWKPKTRNFSIEQLSLVFGKNFVLSFQETATSLFDIIRTRLRSSPNQRLRQQGSDYLVYRLVDTAVDQYFVVLEGLGEHIENVEEHIIAAPTPHNAHTLYRLKHQLMLLRKAIWPMREAISYLSHAEGDMITSFTRLYLRDVYDHTVQAIDSLEAFRDMLSSMLDMYLSSLTNRMNEIMKTLTIIATIFIPITWLASIYGMNFTNMPELRWRWGYPTTLGLMVIMAIVMLIYFRRKKWL